MESKKFSKLDEEFVCFNCGKKVDKLNYTSRDHCPYCLYSKHIDNNPGDRANPCHGKLKPINVELNSKKGVVIEYKCQKCGEIKRNKAANDDDFDEILKIMSENSKKA